MIVVYYNDSELLTSQHYLPLMKMTIIQAILEVMRSEARPMTVREIYECIVRLDLYNFRAVDPVHVVRS